MSPFVQFFRSDIFIIVSNLKLNCGDRIGVVILGEMLQEELVNVSVLNQTSAKIFRLFLGHLPYLPLFFRQQVNFLDVLVVRRVLPFAKMNICLIDIVFAPQEDNLVLFV